MRYILEQDYSTLIRDEIRNLISDSYDHQKLIVAENMAIGQIRNFLSGRYDTDVIFEGITLGDPDTRNHYIVMITIDCTLYHLYTSTAPDRIPEHRSTRYQDAIDWLKSVGKAEIIADLPKIETNSGTIEGLFIGSKYPPRNNKF